MADETPKTSFIPKQSMGSVPGRAPKRRRHFNIFSFVGMVIFLCGVILSVGVFVYKDLTDKDLANKKAELQERKTSFSQSDIESLRELDRRMNVSEALLDQHLAPSILFDMLERRTQEDVQFTEFTYTRRESGSVELVLNGTALRFNTIALQGRQFADARALASAIFSDLSVSEEEGVTFTVTSAADTGALEYTVSSVSDLDSNEDTEENIADTELDEEGETGTTTDSGTGTTEPVNTP